MKIKNSLAGVLTIITLLFTTFSNAGDEVEVDKNGVILAGYDAVAYFTKNEAVEGSAKYTATYNDAIYYFSSSRNRDTFKDDSAKYAPQYGGFCAYGLTFGKKLAVNGKAFEIVDGKLYVNKSQGVYETWSEARDENIVTANVKWSEVENTPIKEL